MYYPINKEDRATGFLIPIYGSSTIRGQTLSNAFFWAINRSQDATFYHDWYSKTGPGLRRRVPLREGAGIGRQLPAFDHRRARRRPTSSRTAAKPSSPATHNYPFNGNLCRRCRRHMRLTANANYFSSWSSQQRYQQDIFQSTNRTRRYGGNLTGNWGATRQHVRSIGRDVHERRRLDVYGSAPRVTLTRAESADRQAAALLRRLRRVRRRCCGATSPRDVETTAASRASTSYPALRFPFTPLALPHVQLVGALARHLLDGEPRPDAGARRSRRASQPPATSTCPRAITGPVFTRIFNTPNSVVRPEVQARHRADAHRFSG